MSKPQKIIPYIEINENVGGSWLRMGKIFCKRCNAVDQVKIMRGHALMAPAYVIKKFSALGWHVGTTTNGNICPDCQKRKTATQLIVVKNTEEKMGKIEPIVKQEPPRVMSREDRRIVFEKLNGVYLDEKRGYDNGWSDERVSSDLGVPRVWVEQVREEMFGPVASNPEMQEFARALNEIQEIKTQLASLTALRNQLNNIDTILKAASIPAMTDRVAKLEKLAVEVKKHCVGI